MKLRRFRCYVSKETGESDSIGMSIGSQEGVGNVHRWSQTEIYEIATAPRGKSSDADTRQ